MENSYAAVASEKEDSQLLGILEEHVAYEPEAILAVIAEIEKRNLQAPNLEQIKQDTLQNLLQREQQLNPEPIGPASLTDKFKDFWGFFVPKRHYFVTPILVNTNIVIFVLLALAGMHVLSPEGEDLVNAGANFGPYTLTGEPWRLFTSMFLHIGIIHLLVNMYALVSIGGALEPLVGRKQFITAYILCGLAGSLASLWWDQQRISAGASGAIFGMFGMFMTMVLLEQRMTWAEKKGMVFNMLGVIALNLVFGLKGGIDNAAHTGGLLLGIAYGAVLMLRSGRYFTQHYNLRGSIVTVALLLGAFVGLYLQIPTENARYLTMLDRFGERETKAMDVMKEMELDATLISGGKYLQGLEQGIALWDESIKDLITLQELSDLGEQQAKEVEILLSYTQLRKTSYTMMRDDIQSNKPWMHQKQQRVLWAIGTYVQELQALRGGEEHESKETESEIPVDVEVDKMETLDPDAKPLFVIDGEPLEQMNLNDVEEIIHPDDVESISVLKGEEAVAKYGEKAQNGVVEIISKQK
ncbi:rhomboid family intramembrane serine protease [Pontibacter sp. HSC-14F20]|uniref:rhomboid family intramembrane serine protease n=1 Tax=Pontibacter sp. HSC-14F20 TaxID=2864136 RepID=UPI001C73B3B9|nr:rhomboid family intramembrane serine protease [Pontibacter sp. HSC-14F20]MBX0333720.1 rhomboid family intramembrane serine protease [Pontibacter sp. HSC-14F20]